MEGAAEKRETKKEMRQKRRKKTGDKMICLFSSAELEGKLFDT